MAPQLEYNNDKIEIHSYNYQEIKKMNISIQIDTNINDLSNLNNINIKNKLTLYEQLRLLLGPELTENELLNLYDIQHILGTGATANVYYGINKNTLEYVAMKEFNKSKMIQERSTIFNPIHTSSHSNRNNYNYYNKIFFKNEQNKEKAFKRVQRRIKKIISELNILKLINHPNIIKYINAYETNERIVIIHEYIEGSDLLEYIIKNGKLNETLACYVFKQIILALKYCHDYSICHRDLKPENILITSNFHVKLIDFGLAEKKDNSLLNTICGTPLYCCPEMLFMSNEMKKKNGFCGKKADIWSAGIVLYAMMTGCAPFDDTNINILKYEMNHRNIIYPDYFSNELINILDLILTNDHNKRPTCDEILNSNWIMESIAPFKNIML